MNWSETERHVSTGRDWSVANVKVCIGGAIRLLVREQQFRMGPGRAISWMHCDFYPRR